MGEENKAKPQDEKKARPQRKTKTLDTYQRLADVSLRTSATTLTILFAYAFATSTNTTLGQFKYFVLGVGFLLFCSVICALVSLFGVSEKESRFIKGFGIASVILMSLGLGFAFILLASALFH
jgi:hypothetical protein